MLNCYQFKNYISSFLDEGISLKNRQAFEEHLKQCSKCQALLNQVTKNREVMRNLPQVNVSENFYFKLRNRILAAQQLQKKQAGAPAFSLNRIPSFAYGFALAFLAVVIGFIVLGFQGEKNPGMVPPPVLQSKINQYHSPQSSPAAPQSNLPPQQYVNEQAPAASEDTLNEDRMPERDDTQRDFQGKIKTVKDQR